MTNDCCVFRNIWPGFELLIVDELGFVPLSKTGAEMLFEIVSQRYERAATMVTSNPLFNEWMRSSVPSDSPKSYWTGSPITFRPPQTQFGTL
jgi:hypothetical protein